MILSEGTSRQALLYIEILSYIKKGGKKNSMMHSFNDVQKFDRISWVFFDKC